MKNAHQCPKCQSGNIYKVPGHRLNTYQQIPLNKWSTKNAVLDRYICGDCGYTEEFVQLNEKFYKWAEKALDKLSDENSDFV